MVKRYGVQILTVHRVLLKWEFTDLFVFLYVEVLRHSQITGVMSSGVSLLNHTFTGQA